MIVDELVEAVEFRDPEKVFANVIPQNLEVLHVHSTGVAHPAQNNRQRKREGKERGNSSSKNNKNNMNNKNNKNKRHERSCAGAFHATAKEADAKGQGEGIN